MSIYYIAIHTLLNYCGRLIASSKIFAMGFCRALLAHLAVISLIFAPTISYAQQVIIAPTAAPAPLPIVADGSTNTQITKTASGIDQINIAAPEASGLSHNRFTDYNINEAGQVINNFSGANSAEIIAGSGPTAVTRTNIAGLVTSNQNLANSGSATIILNEVTSSHNTALNGYAEIAGRRAELIIANPNGITCNSCGFINTARLSLIGGRSSFDENGKLSGFNLNAPNNADSTQQYIRSGVDGNNLIPVITITGLGLDVEDVSATEIIARSVKLASSIYAGKQSDVAIRTGNKFYDLASKGIESSVDKIAAGDNRELFAIDASGLNSSIQAGRIFLVATQNGLGVNSKGSLVAENSVLINANGDVKYNVIAAGGDVWVRSDRDVVSLGADSVLVAGGNLTLIAGQNFNNLGVVQGQKAVNIAVANFNNAVDATVWSVAGDLQIEAAGKITNAGLVKTFLGRLTLEADGLENLGRISADSSNLAINTNTNINNSGILQGNSLNFVTTNFNNSGIVRAFNLIDISSTNLTNQNLIRSFLGSVNIDTQKIVNLSNGEISAAQNLNFSKLTILDNSGSIKAGGSLLAANLNDINNSGIIAVNDSLSLNLQNLTNSGLIYSKNNLSLTLNSLDQSGIIFAEKNLDLSADLSFKNSGKIYSGLDMTLLTNGAFNNMGVIYSDKNLSLSKSSSISNEGTIFAAANLALFADNVIENRGMIGSRNNLDLTATSSFANFGIIKADKILSIKGNSDLTLNFNNSGSIAGGSVDINSSLAQNFGTITADNKIDLAAIGFKNTNLFYSLGDLTIALENNLINSGIIKSGQNTEISAIDMKNTNKIIAGNNLKISGNLLANGNESLNIASNEALIQAGSNLELNLNLLDNRNTKSLDAANATSGIISLNGDIIINAISLNNDLGLLQAKNSINFNRTQINNDLFAKSKALSIVSNKGLSALQSEFKAQSTRAKTSLSYKANYGLLNDGGSIISNNVSIDVGANNHIIEGLISAANLDIAAKNITNKTNLNISDNISLRANSGYIINGISGGDNSAINLIAGSNITLIADLYVRNYGAVSSGRDLTITSNNNAIANYSRIKGGVGNTIISAERGFFNNREVSLLTSANVLTFNLESLNNTGSIIAEGDLIINTSLDLNNKTNALIWAGKNLTLNIERNINNYSSTIYAKDGFLKIQNSTGGKINQLLNYSGKIISYGLNANLADDNDERGNISIQATKIINRRLVDVVEKRIPLPKNNAVNLAYWTKDGNTYTAKNEIILNENSVESIIDAGNKLSIKTASIGNNLSKIYSASDAEILLEGAAVFGNANTYSAPVGFIKYKYESSSSDKNQFFQIVDGVDNRIYKESFASFSSYISSGGSLKITKNGENFSFANRATITEFANLTHSQAIVANANFDTAQQVRALDVKEVAVDVAAANNLLGISNIDNAASNDIAQINSLKSRLNGISENSSASNINNIGVVISNIANQKNNPHKPTKESRRRFNDLLEFYGADDFYEKIGFDTNNLTRSIRVIENNNNVKNGGDANNNIDNAAIASLATTYFEEGLLTQKQLASLLKDALYISEYNDINKYTKSADNEFYQNSKRKLSRLNLSKKIGNNSIDNGKSINKLKNPSFKLGLAKTLQPVDFL